MAGYFITGTDTGIGKTRVALALMAELKKSSAKVVGMKPVASGCVYTKAGLRNEDALQIQRQGNIETLYEHVNPYAFEPPVAPHAAAAEADVAIDLPKIANCYDILARTADIVIVEGIGGWRVPLGNGQTLADLVRCLKLPIIMVVGLRLGCINHALLTAEAIAGDGLQLNAWVANQLEPGYPALKPTIDCLSANIQAPMLGFIPFMKTQDLSAIAGCLDLQILLQPEAF